MKELSLHILDVAQNGITAGATRIDLTVSSEKGMLTLSVKDNGKGMSPEFAAKVTDPFTTTRTTRKVGLGLPLFKLAAEQAGGNFSLETKEGVGTTVTASFAETNIDTPPLGDMPGTMVTLIQGSPELDFTYTSTVDGQVIIEFDTREIREALEGVPLSEPEVLAWIEETLREEPQ